jgi:hypothetical protein
MPETIPDQTSNAGPESRRSDDDWRDFLDYATDAIRCCDRAERVFHQCQANNTASSVNTRRIAAINSAIEMLERAKEDLCR